MKANPVYNINRLYECSKLDHKVKGLNCTFELENRRRVQRARGFHLEYGRLDALADFVADVDVPWHFRQHISPHGRLRGRCAPRQVRRVSRGLLQFRPVCFYTFPIKATDVAPDALSVSAAASRAAAQDCWVTDRSACGRARDCVLDARALSGLSTSEKK